jgi:hypothetical protein
VSIFDELPTGMVSGKAPDGYRARVYTGVGDVPAEEVLRKVEEVGGWLHREPVPRSGLRAGRLFARTQEVSWLVIPESAFDDADR